MLHLIYAILTKKPKKISRTNKGESVLAPRGGYKIIKHKKMKNLKQKILDKFAPKTSFDVSPFVGSELRKRRMWLEKALDELDPELSKQQLMEYLVAYKINKLTLEDILLLLRKK